jgi:quercetin dioxygenase-like cupin family protein
MNKPSLAVLAFGCGLVASTAASSTPPLLGSSAVSWDEIEGAAGKGNSRPIFRSPTATLDELEMHVTHLAPGKAPHPPHQHPQEEVVIIREGTLEALQNGKTRRLGPGSVLFQAANQLHGVRNVGTLPATYYVVRWTSPGMAKAAPPAPPR